MWNWERAKGMPDLIRISGTNTAEFSAFRDRKMSHKERGDDCSKKKVRLNATHTVWVTHHGIPKRRAFGKKNGCYEHWSCVRLESSANRRVHSSKRIVCMCFACLGFGKRQKTHANDSLIEYAHYHRSFTFVCVCTREQKCARKVNNSLASGKIFQIRQTRFRRFFCTFFVFFHTHTHTHTRTMIRSVFDCASFPLPERDKRNIHTTCNPSWGVRTTVSLRGFLSQSLMRTPCTSVLWMFEGVTISEKCRFRLHTHRHTSHADLKNVLPVRASCAIHAANMSSRSCVRALSTSGTENVSIMPE